MKQEIITINNIKKIFETKKYTFFDGKDFDLNIIGIRSNSSISDKFDDFLVVICKVNSEWIIRIFPCTTDPGKHWLLNPMNVNGTAIIVPGQYRSSHCLGKHKDYDALVQCGELAIVRDNNKDLNLNFELMKDPKNILKVKWKGLNIHRASKWKKLFNVNMYSAGCQVIQDPTHFEQFMWLCKKQIETGVGNTFTYTLIEENDFNLI